MIKSRKIFKLKRAVLGITAFLLAISCFGFDYDVFAADNPANTEAPVYENPPILTDITEVQFNYTTVESHQITLSLVEGSTTTIDVPTDRDGVKISYSSDDPSIATINEQGVVTAYKTGKTTLHYGYTKTIGTGVTHTTIIGYTIDVTVTSATVEATGITLDQNNLEMVKGDTKTIGYTVTPADATDKNVAWSSSNTSVATVGGNGSVTAVGIGTATITARLTNGISASANVTVTGKPESIRLSTNNLSMKKGETQTLSYTITPAGVTDNVTWASSDSSVASVSNGVITAKKKGTAVITVQTSNGCSDTCYVTVITEIEKIAFSESNVTLNIGEERQTSIIITPSDITDADVTLTISNPSVISISSSGVIKALKAGTATITATTANGKTAKMTVTVNQAVPEKITVSPTSVEQTLRCIIKITE